MREHSLPEHASLDHLSSRAQWRRRCCSDRSLQLAILELRKHRPRNMAAPDGPRAIDNRVVRRKANKVAR